MVGRYRVVKISSRRSAMRRPSGDSSLRPDTCGISLSPPMPIARRTRVGIDGDPGFGERLDPRARVGVVAVDERAVDVEDHCLQDSVAVVGERHGLGRVGRFAVNGGEAGVPASRGLLHRTVAVVLVFEVVRVLELVVILVGDAAHVVAGAATDSVRRSCRAGAARWRPRRHRCDYGRWP